jgi:hypothetical protein
VWWLLLGACGVAVAGILAMPEPAARRPGVLASLRPRVNVPPRARGAFVVAVPCLVAAWALAGLYLSLGPSLAAQVLADPGERADLILGAAAAGSMTVRNRSARRASARLGASRSGTRRLRLTCCSAASRTRRR